MWVVRQVGRNDVDAMWAPAIECAGYVLVRLGDQHDGQEIGCTGMLPCWATCLYQYTICVNRNSALPSTGMQVFIHADSSAPQFFVIERTLVRNNTALVAEYKYDVRGEV